ncbi:hypothetical protein D3C80_1738010 [compost metagenome]
MRTTSGSDSQATGEIPSRPIAWLIRPKSLLNSHCQTIATAAGMVTAGKNSRVRSSALPRMFWFRPIASSSDRLRLTGTHTTT